MKLSKVKELSASEFIYHLTNPKQGEAVAHVMETNAWLEHNGAKPLKKLGNWSGVVTEADARRKMKAEILVCIEAIINAGRSAGGKKSSANMTPEQRKERAKKAVQARIKKYNQKVL